MTTPTLAPASFLFSTNLGWMALAWRGERIERLTIGHPSAAAAAASLDLDAATTDRRNLPAVVADLVDRLQRYSDGETVSFDDVPVDLSHLTPFQLKVVRACRKINRGRTRTYGELAVAAGSPGASRAVGSVMAKNRLPIIIPCHRVVGAGGSLGGFSAPDGLGMKQRMLRLEGHVTIAAKPRRAHKALLR
ncbi:MAG: MGMT family protein [Planctomycetaceae bacterium]|nr:MGMT family protein [Planctomycetaceae bacterium]